MKWIFVTIILVFSSPMFCNALCKHDSSYQTLHCMNTTYEEYKNFILNEVKQPISYIIFENTTITSLNNTFFDFKQVKNITTFSTRYCSIEKLEAFTFSVLKKLQTLSFKNNDVPLEIITNALNDLSLLQHFSAYNCKISHIEPITFGGLLKLQVINLSFNNITTLKSLTFLGASNVINLLLYGSQISHIAPDAFNDLDNLESLVLGGNKLKTLSLGTFKNLKKVVYLQLNDNRLDSLNFGALEGLSNLEYMYIHGNNIKVLDVSDVHKYTPKLKKIQIQ